jgi:hypothetical protein
MLQYIVMFDPSSYGTETAEYAGYGITHSLERVS